MDTIPCCESCVLQPKDINIPLYLHQLKSIKEMATMEIDKHICLSSTKYIRTNIGALSDLPGYGKSFTVLGLISHTLSDYCSDDFFLEKIVMYNYVSVCEIKVLKQLKCTLIVVNISLLSQWIHELNRTLLKYIAIHNKNEIEELDINKYDVIVVANNIYNIFAQVNRNNCWKRMVIDEPTSLKINSMETSNAMFYWIVTATPLELYLKRRLYFLNDLLPEDVNVFKNLIIKNDDEFVKQSYQMPNTRHLYYKCADNISHFFEDVTNSNIVEMLDASNTNDVLGILHAHDNISIYDAFIEKKQKRLNELSLVYNSKNESKILIIQNQLKIFMERIYSYVTNKFKNIDLEIYIPKIFMCCQAFSCGDDTQDVYCPHCLSPDIQLVPLIYWNTIISTITNVVLDHSLQNLNKIDRIFNIINHEYTTKKILIFSNYNETFTIIRRFLDNKKLLYLELKGTKERRDNIIESYKTGQINILLLNTLASGAGLNLQETTDIILYHSLPEFQKIQVLGRANRIGRVVDLTVHYL